jgi:RHS repeat-associated protein
VIAPNQPTSGAGGSATNQRSAAAPPAISLPKGGGAIRGIGEKFAANPVTGTGSMSVPIATSPGRSGFAPQLALSYDSGAGNGPFGFGWSLSLPSITRKTDKGLPKYEDADESDVFILSGAEDLVPVFRTNPTTGEFLKDANGKFVYDEFPRDGYLVRRYRPRIEGLFARIERWTRQSDGDVHWRSISKDNITTWYGETEESRVANAADGSQIFSWLICQSYDDKGNAIIYEYQREDSERIFEDQEGDVIALAHERNRDDSTRSANRYLKRIKYGNRKPNRDTEWKVTDPAQLPNDTWMFEVVVDYGEGHYTEDAPDSDEQIFVQAQADPPAGSHWPVRRDPISTYRSGFEVRTYRLCRHVLMFHHFPQELGVDDCLVHSTEFSYAESPIASFITGLTQSGYVRRSSMDQPNAYLKKSLPPLEFEYSQVPSASELAQRSIREVDSESLENLPAGLDGGEYQWMDLDGEGTSGVLTEQADAWYYKRNLSANNVVLEDGHQHTVARLGTTEVVARKPAVALVGGGQFLDLAGDGQVDLVEMEGSLHGFYERTDDSDWSPFQAFASWPEVSIRDPDVKFVDLTGDGHADILITEGEVLTWYPSLAEDGFGPSFRVNLPLDEEKGPRVVFADGNESIYLADLSGDGLSDLVRIRNGEVCYWPNLGYGRFGAKVTMDNAPWFDSSDQFDQRRIRLADTDGSGTTDILYLRRDGVQIYFNQSGNGWSDAVALPQFPPIDNISSVQALDLLGNGTACLVWSSPLPGAARRPMRYIDLMEEKPHLLVGVKNNLGAETKIHYAPSTKFYLDDKQDGKPWITRLPFPVHVVDRVETLDLISRNRFVTRIVPHHGFYDPVEREFRGFGMVEQFDTEELAALTESSDFPDAANIDAASYVPTVCTKTWFHTGAYVEGGRISRHFEEEYYHEGDESEGLSGLTDQQLEAMLLPDTKLPTTLKWQDSSSVPWELTTEEMREACRALKGAVIRREIYALDGTDDEDRPYSATEQNYAIELLQPQGDDKHAVFLTHLRESIDFHYERKLVKVGEPKRADPRVAHAMTLEVDGYGNVLKSTGIGYGRRPGLSPLEDNDKNKQEQLLITYIENAVTNPIDEADDYRIPLPCEARTYELLKVVPDSKLPDITNLFGFEEMVGKAGQASDGSHDLPYEDIDAIGAAANHPYRRLIEHVRTLYRRNNLSGTLPAGKLDSLAITFESYKLAFTSGLLDQVHVRNGQKLLPANPADILEGGGAHSGGYVELDGDDNWWIPSGKVFFHVDANITNPTVTASQELAEAHAHFFLPRKFADPFSQSATVDYDVHDLLVIKSEDALHNTVNAANDYRVLQPQLVTDPNGNRSEVAFDALGMVAGTAVMGKVGEHVGDSLTNFNSDLMQQDINDLLDASDPHLAAPNLLGNASTRIIYDLDCFKTSGQPVFSATLARETHTSDPLPPGGLKIQIAFSYSDGFGREVQKKIQAEPGPVPRRDANGKIIVGANGQPVMTPDDVSPRWVGSGWMIFNNKGKPVRQYEPFFTDTHHFEFDVKIGVSPVLFYDPVERVVANLHPNHSWEKVVFDPWQQTTYDVNDTVMFDPKTDDDVKEFFTRLPDADYLPTWYDKRIALAANNSERVAAEKAAVHHETPTGVYFDCLGRPFLTIAHNKFERNGVTVEEKYSTRIVLDIEGNQREVIDAKDRIVMRYDYDMLGTRIHQASMEAGERWTLNDVKGKPIRAWDSRGFMRRITYDEVRRPTGLFVTEKGSERLAERTIYGESQGDANNQRTRVFRMFDAAGIVTSEEYDFKGNLLKSARDLLPDYKGEVDWQENPDASDGTFTTSTKYDALNRPTQLIAPHADQAGAAVNVVEPMYNEANLLEQVHGWLNQNAEPTGWLNPATANLHVVTNIDYNAKGQRELIDYGNGASTTYDYDPETFRLARLKTTRKSDKAVLQDLNYTYDPTGNITHIQDNAQQTIYFNGQVVPPHCDYVYDAIYRLIAATGREHIGQVSQPATTWNDEFRANLPHPHNGQAMRNFDEHYLYDAVGNLEKLIHQAAANGSWTREYAYNEASLIEPVKKNNRLSSTTVGQTTETYPYDEHGNMTAMPHLTLMQWDFKDQLQATARQVVNNGTPETTFYVYNASGQRMRKVTERENGIRKSERTYLGGFEIYREYDGSGSSVTLERETLHAMDDKQRIALVEIRTQGTDGSLAQLIRYQSSNHLGSASLELDDKAQIISYEEYYPYGSTSYQAVRSQTETAKRYRYTGKERDEETGFTYHGARYYPPWLGRWLSTDPAGLADGANLYWYAKDSPVVLFDPTGHQSEKLNGLAEHMIALKREIAKMQALNKSSLSENERNKLEDRISNAKAALNDLANYATHGVLEQAAKMKKEKQSIAAEMSEQQECGSISTAEIEAGKERTRAIEEAPERITRDLENVAQGGPLATGFYIAERSQTSDPTKISASLQLGVITGNVVAAVLAATQEPGVTMLIGGPGVKRVAPTTGAGPRRFSAAKTAKDAHDAGLVNTEKGRLGFGSHSTAPSRRRALEISGSTHESAHIVPQAVYRQLGKGPGKALTADLPKAIHKQIDAGWVKRWNAAIEAGEEITAGDVRQWVGEAIQGVPDATLSPAAKGTLQWRLDLELHQLGLNPTSVIVPKRR